MSSSSNPEGASTPAPPPSTQPESKPAMTIEDLARLLETKVATLTLASSEIKVDLASLRGDVFERLDAQERTVADVDRRLAALESTATAQATSGPAYMPSTTTTTEPPTFAPVIATPYLGQSATTMQASSSQTSTRPVPVSGINAQMHSRVDGRVGQAGSGDVRNDVRVEPSALASSDQSAVYEKALYCKPERLGEFRGDPFDLEFWIGSVRDIARTNPSRAWQAAVRAAIPFALKGDAHEWHVGLNDEEVNAMPDLPSYFDAMRANFPVNYIKLREKALQRKWEPFKETALGYSQVKIRLLRQVSHAGTPEEHIVNDVLDGLLPSLQQVIRLPRGRQRTIQALKAELGEQEPIWRAIHKIEIADKGSVNAIAIGNNQGAFTHLETTHPPTAFPSEQRRSFRYDPGRVVEAQGGAPRQYRKENGRVLRLNRPCGKCGQQHFDFEHDALIGSPKVYSLVETLDYEEVGEVLSSDF
ncbi:hypothetical protein CF326_g7272 [Tilletia indica]|nr:hypothetical protein CF326_g7272 [Tilletia indica]